MSVTTTNRRASIEEIAAEMDRRGQVIERIEARNDDLTKALRDAERAIAEFYRYHTGGETRGSYDGRPEREGLWRAMYAARSTLSSLSPAPQPVKQGRCKVPTGQTPLNDDLGHPLLDVYQAGQRSREEGTASPYHGHSLEHCLHAAGWVARDLRMALDAAKATPPAPQPVGEVRDRLHPSHKNVRSSIDASTFDMICDDCGNHDKATGGWGLLAEPCPAAPSSQAQEDGR